MASIANDIRLYLRQTLGADVAPSPSGVGTGLPPFLRERYTFLDADLLGHPLVLALDRADAEDLPSAVQKHLAIVRASSKRDVVYVRERMTPFNRMRLIRHHVPFIVPRTQLYLPDLGTDLREHFKPWREPRPHFRPGTQSILISLLLRSNEGAVSASRVAATPNYSPMTMSRAFDELVDAGLATSETRGRERWISLQGSHRDVWSRAQAWLRSPVKSRHFVHPATFVHPGMKAGLSALAAYTDLEDPPAPTVAIERRSWMRMKRDEHVHVFPLEEVGAIEVEVWSYSPLPFRETSVVDPLSLFLSLAHLRNERVHHALNEMIASLPW